MPFLFGEIDAKAEALLVANEKAMRTLTSFRAEGTIVTASLGSDGKPQFERYASLTVVMARPALLREETWPTTPEGRKTDSVPNSLSVSNGKTLLIQSGRGYRRLPATPSAYPKPELTMVVSLARRPRSKQSSPKRRHARH